MTPTRTIIAIIAPHDVTMTHVLPYLNKLGAVELRQHAVLYVDLGRARDPRLLRSKLIMIRATIQTLLNGPIRIGAGSNKTVALVAARQTAPGGILVVPSGTESSFLDHAVIDLLPGIGRRTATYLKNRGVRTIGHFRKLPQFAAVQLFGISGIALHAYSRGSDPRDVMPHQLRTNAIRGRQSLFSLFGRAAQAPESFVVAGANAA